VTTLLEQQQPRPIAAEIDAAREDWSEPALEETAVEPPLPRPRVRSRTLFNDIRDTILMVVAIYTLVNLIAPRYIVEGGSM